MQETEITFQAQLRSWLRPMLRAKPWRQPEVLIALVILVTAFTSRFYDLETRVMSHDESEHTYFAWFFSEYGSYQQTPITHGPLQFHLLAAVYRIFGDSDASSRFPAAAAGVLAIGMLFFFRRWLKSSGALIAMAIMLVSPYFLFYSRYVRNEPLLVPVVLLMFYSVLRYYETHEKKWLFALTASLTLHFVIKETAFLYALELLIFLGLVLVWNLLRRPWKTRAHLNTFTLGLFGFVLGSGVLVLRLRDITSVESAGGPTPILVASFIGAIGGVAAMAIAMGLTHGVKLRTEFPSLDMIIVVATLLLPQLGAFPAKLLGWDPLDYGNVDTMVKTTSVVVFITAITATVGILWDWRRWQVIAGIFIIPYAVLYTSLFTNLAGFASGIVGSFGYWLSQQEVQRGGQPWYYYLGIQIPIYEYLAALGSLVVAGVGIRHLVHWVRDRRKSSSGTGTGDEPLVVNPILFLGFWVLISLLMFSYAGERMPWLTIHIVLPMILLSGWIFGRIVDRFRSGAHHRPWHFTIPLAIAISLGAIGYVVLELMGWAQPLFGEASPNGGLSFSVMVTLTVAVLFGLIAWFLSRQVEQVPIWRWTPIALFIGVFILSARTAVLAAYQNYDYATEFMVYAHGERGVKDLISKLEGFSQSLYGDNSIDVRYDNADLGGDPGVSWPMTWYLRDYANASPFGPEITRELRTSTAIIASDNNFGRIEPLLENYFQGYDYLRMVWPIQDYWKLTLERLSNVLKHPELREALWEIWFNRDYTAYAIYAEREISLENWQPSRKMRLYLRNDVVAQVTGEDVGLPTDELQLVDPYADGIVDLPGESFLAGDIMLNKPRSAAFAPDGSVYVLDTGNNRVLHFNSSGDFIQGWGEYANADADSDTSGKFNEPWGIAVGPDGSVYVADTWNHRVQKFTAEGEFLIQWGEFGTDGALSHFYGPRSIAIDSESRIYVSDTGNKRIQVFSDTGEPITQIGSPGFQTGELDEPVGIAVDSSGRLVVADTWNTRVQVFEGSAEAGFGAVGEWAIDGWYGQSLENKPYIAVGPEDQVCVTDPEGYRVLCFNDQGKFLFGWGSGGDGSGQFNLATSLVIDPSGGTLVVDSGNNRVLKFSPPW